MTISQSRAVELVLGTEQPERVIDYGGGWLIWRASLEGRIGDSVTLVDRDGGVRSALSYEIGDLLGVIAKHHGMTRQEAASRFPRAQGFDGQGPGPRPTTGWV